MNVDLTIVQQQRLSSLCRGSPAVLSLEIHTASLTACRWVQRERPQRPHAAPPQTEQQGRSPPRPSESTTARRSGAFLSPGGWTPRRGRRWKTLRALGLNPQGLRPQGAPRLGQRRRNRVVPPALAARHSARAGATPRAACGPRCARDACIRAQGMLSPKPLSMNVKELALCSASLLRKDSEECFRGLRNFVRSSKM